VPYAQKLSSSTIVRPRRSAGANSLTSVLATGSSPPSPTPAKNRITASAAADHAKAESPVSRLYASSVHVNTAFRPNRSATIPPSAAPRNIPIRFAVMISPTTGFASPHCLPIAATTLPTKSRSIASKSQPPPAARRRRR
jgi:hypothetical protein